MNRRKTEYIVTHCSATPPTMDIGAKTINKWHTDPKPKGNGWRDIGYHFVIRRNGDLEIGRGLDEIGAHVKGYNHLSVGVCLVGGINQDGAPENNFTAEQFDTLDKVYIVLRSVYPNAAIVGHNQLNPYKSCPCFNVSEYVKGKGLT